MIDKINNFRAIAIYGVVGSGKTALTFKFLEQLSKEKEVYFVKFPKVNLLEKFGYNNLYSFEEIVRVSNCVVVFDEAQLPSGTSQYKKEKMLIGLLSLARQRDITLIIATSDTRAFTQRVEAYFDLWILKDIEPKTIKQRSILRGIISDNTTISPDEFSLNVNEYVSYCRSCPELNGRHTFDLPLEWSNELSKPYAITTEEKLQKNTTKKDSKENKKVEVYYGEVNKLPNPKVERFK